MGVPSVGSTSGEERDGEDTDPGEVNLGVTDDAIQTPDSSSGAVEGLRGIGSASVMEILHRSKIPRLEVPAAWASQGPMELLQVQQNPEQAKLPQNALGAATPVPKPEGGTDARCPCDTQPFGLKCLKLPCGQQVLHS